MSFTTVGMDNFAPDLTEKISRPKLLYGTGWPEAPLRMSPRPLPYFSLTTRMAIALESKLQSIAAIRNPSSNWMARTSLPPTPATRNETGVLFSRLDIGLYENSSFLSGDWNVSSQ